MELTPDEVMPRFRQTPKSSPCNSDKVYVVRLTEEERQALIALVRAAQFGELGDFERRICSARPEHPERQQALELVAKAARRATLVMSEPGTKLLLGALDRLEALCAAARWHPERQAALEELLAAVKNYRDAFEAAEGFITTDVVNAEERLDNAIRSLEGK